VKAYVSALPAVQNLLELILHPDEIESEGWPIGAESWDPAFTDEIMLHRSLRIRDRLFEFSLRRTELDLERKRALAQIEATEETLGRMKDVHHLLVQRGALRRFLQEPVTTASVRARARAQAELEKVEQLLEARRTVRMPPEVSVARTLTPQLYWVKRDASLPKEGTPFGRPGDVVIFVRPAVEGQVPRGIR
jgi:hypothetical protein